MRHLLTLGPLLVAACATQPSPAPDAPGPTDTVPADDTVRPPPGPVGPGEARASVVVDEAQLLGGMSAEGRVGDVLIENAQVRFVLQGIRPGSFYVTEWGGIIDVDLVRPDGAPGGDLIEKWSPMVGLGRLLAPSSIEVVADGLDGGAAIVRIEATESPLALLEGTLESTDVVADLGLTATHELVLQPDRWLLEVTTTVRVDAPAPLTIADVLFGAPESAWTFTDGAGLSGDVPTTFQHTGYVAAHEGLAVATLSAGPDPLTGGGLDLLAELVDLAVAGGPSIPAGPDQERSFTRYYGVAPHLEALTFEAAERAGRPMQEVAGQVTAPDGPVANARVIALADGEPFTMAIADADGRFVAHVPEGTVASARALGWTTGRFTDLGQGAALYGPYAPAPQRAATLASLDASGPADVEGRGWADDATPLVLGQPGEVQVVVADGAPFAVELRRTAPWAAPDARLAPSRDGARAASAWSRGGTATLRVEPGTYDAVVHRGLRHEVFAQRITVEAGTPTVLEPTLPVAYTAPGWLVGDPHSHAAPSGDGEILMEDRLIVAAATGVQVHFGTDHDHVADYRPLRDALGLRDVLATVVADEVSPPLRGHYNAYPLVSDPTVSNGGAWLWWEDIPATTDAIVDALRARHGPDVLVQSNHPFKSSLAALGQWSPGRIGRGTHWTSRIDAIEVLNSGSTGEAVDFYLDLVTRGLPVTPTGVSDSHGHHSGHPGMSVTFLGAGTDDPAAFTDAKLVELMRAQRVVVSRGPFLDLSIDPGTVVTGGADLDVVARSPSWIVVDRLKLLRDGVVVETVTGTTATFSLRPDVDAAYVVIAEGDTPMTPVDDRTPWALAAAIKVDVAGDGWSPPLPPLVISGG